MPKRTHIIRSRMGLGSYARYSKPKPIGRGRGRSINAIGRKLAPTKVLGKTRRRK